MTEAPAIACPGCAAPMTSQVLEAHQGTQVTIDLCRPCQAFWFDAYESLQLTPASTLRLFRVIGEEAARERRALPPAARCPRCALPLRPVEDMQRNTRFRYGRCPRGHGRFITFFDFLREKNFVKVLSAQQLAELRAQVDTVNCSNCGAPVDLQAASACAHCGTALSFFDTAHAQALIAQLREAESTPARLSPTLPLDLLRARNEAEKAFPAADRALWLQDVAAAGTVTAGVMAFVRWLASRTPG
ncbi:MAG: hypothetical protein U0Q55_02105 [Vicinamibacterales bacterium]